MQCSQHVSLHKVVANGQVVAPATSWSGLDLTGIPPTAHFERDPALLPIDSKTFDQHEHPNIQLALDRFLAEDEITSETLGIAGAHS